MRNLTETLEKVMRDALVSLRWIEGGGIEGTVDRGNCEHAGELWGIEVRVQKLRDLQGNPIRCPDDGSQPEPIREVADPADVKAGLVRVGPYVVRD